MVAIAIDAQHDLIDLDNDNEVFHIRHLGLKVGRISLRANNDNARFLLAYGIRQGYRNKGVMGRAVGIVCKHIFTQYPGAKMIAQVSASNAQSRRVCEKNGFGIEAITPGTQDPWVWYALSREGMLANEEDRKVRTMDDLEKLARFQRTTDLYSHITGETRPETKERTFSFFFEDGTSVISSGVGADTEAAVKDATKKAKFLLQAKVSRLDYWMETK